MKTLLTTFLALMCYVVNAQEIRTITGGDWINPTIWNGPIPNYNTMSGHGDVIIEAGDQVTLENTLVFIPGSSGLTINDQLRVNSINASGTPDISGTGSLIVFDDFIGTVPIELNVWTNIVLGVPDFTFGSSLCSNCFLYVENEYITELRSQFTASSQSRILSLTELDEECDQYGICSSTPVQLIKFQGFTQNTGVLLKWSTATELNSSHFEIERSPDLEYWTKIDSVKSHGNSNTKIEYTRMDLDPPSGRVYYRIKQIDFDGKYEYFGPIVVETDQILHAVVIKVKDNIRIQIKSPRGRAKLNLFNSQGIVLKSIEFEYSAYESYQIPVSEFKGGLYCAELIVSNGESNWRQTIRFLSIN